MTTILRGIQSAAQTAYIKIEPTLSSIQKKVGEVWNQFKAKSSESFTSLKTCSSTVFIKLSDAGLSMLHKVQNGLNHIFRHPVTTV